MIHGSVTDLRQMILPLWGYRYSRGPSGLDWWKRVISLDPGNLSTGWGRDLIPLVFCRSCRRVQSSVPSRVSYTLGTISCILGRTPVSSRVTGLDSGKLVLICHYHIKSPRPLSLLTSIITIHISKSTSSTFSRPLPTTTSNMLSHLHELRGLDMWIFTNSPT